MHEDGPPASVSASAMGGVAARGSPIRYRGGGFAPRKLPFAGAIVLLLFLALWQVGCGRGWIDTTFTPSPVEVGRALVALALSGELARHAAASLSRLAVGLALGLSTGIAAGLAIGLFSIARSAGVPIIAALFPIPKIALLPLMIIWFGIGEGSKVAIIAFGSFFPMAIATYGGVDALDRSLVRMGQSFGLSFGRIVRAVVLPGALPAMLSGARTASSIGIVLLIAAEMINASSGLGGFVLTAGNLMATDQLLAGVVVLSALGILLYAGIAWLERRLLAWR